MEGLFLLQQQRPTQLQVRMRMAAKIRIRLQLQSLQIHLFRLELIKVFVLEDQLRCLVVAQLRIHGTMVFRMVLPFHQQRLPHILSREQMAMDVRI